MQDTIHRTLIIRLSSVGDIILSTPLVRGLRKRFPHIQIDFLVKAEYAGLLANNPHVTRVLEFPAGGTFRTLRNLRQTIQRAQYDLIVDIHDSPRSRFLTLWDGVTVRINKRKIPRFLLVKFKWDVYRFFGNAPGVAQRYLETVTPWGIEDDGQGTEVFLPESAHVAAEHLLRSEGWQAGEQFIGICPGSRHFNKTWPADRFAEAAAELSGSSAMPVILLGSADESDLCRTVADRIRHLQPGARVLNLAGRSSLSESAAVLDRCAVVLTNDSGLMHLAAARKRKLVAIFGPTVSQFGFFPVGTDSIVLEERDLRCRPCTHIGLPVCPRGHFRCMNDIPVSRVVAAAREILSHS